jgi:AraC family transcriptional regulator, transcriptional activator FtrA
VRHATTVVVLAPDRVWPSGLAVYCDVFGIDRTGRGLPSFDFTIASERPGVSLDAFGLGVTLTAGLDRLAGADIVAVAPALQPRHAVSPAVTAALRDAVARGARVVAVCSAAFTLAAAGLLDGRRVAANRMYLGEFAKRFPRVRVVPGVRYVDDDPIFTSSGTAAGVDLCLHLIRVDHGPVAADEIARRLVLGPRRGTTTRPVTALAVARRPGRRRFACLSAPYRSR